MASAIRILTVSFIPAILGIILHEIAHGWAAKKCGDPTAQIMGRLTLNPVPHIDPVGLAVFGLTSLTGSFIFGWAKPVPVNPRLFRHAKRDMMLVALAGPCTNFLLALAFGILLFVSVRWLPFPSWQDNIAYRFLLSTCEAGVYINFGLGWLNLIPVPPLDGSKILAYFLPRQWSWRFMDLGRYGFIILVVLLVTGLLGKIIGPLVIYSGAITFTLLGF